MTLTASPDSRLSNTGIRRFAVPEGEAKAAWAADRAHLPEMVQTLQSPNTYRRPEGLDEAGFCDLLIAEMTERIARHAHALGLIARPIGHLIVLSPPLIFTEEHIAQTAAILREAILRRRADLRADGFLA